MIMLVLFPVIHIQILGKTLNAGSTILLFLLLYYANIFIIAARRIRFNIKKQVSAANQRQTVFRSKIAKFLHRIMSTVSGMTLLSFLMMIPIIGFCEIFYILAGQEPDGFIKAFTMTADRTFSKQTPPPPLEYKGHYLCTVAAGGHKKIVKPLRYGIRRGEKIVVNRQLLVANAFEELISERTPKFHHAVRGFYDRHGYPISKLITTKTRADIIYLMMKPLELIFIAALYLFDTTPENRIAVQYSEYKTNVQLLYAKH